MPVVEERLSLLEVKMEEVGTTLVRMEGILGSLHQMVRGLDQRVDKLDQRVDKLDQRVDKLDQRVDKLDQRSIQSRSSCVSTAHDHQFRDVRP